VTCKNTTLEQEDGTCVYDEFYSDDTTAKLACAESFGIGEQDWISVPDRNPDCQQDWISPVRVVGRADGDPQWGQFERLVNGVRRRIDNDSDDVGP
jgi:hypothetical protein